MPNQISNQTASSTLAKLLEVDSELAVTEADLLSQLESVQEKRRSLKTVLSIFTKEADTPGTAVESSVQNLPVEDSRKLEPVLEDLATSQLDTSGITATAEPLAAPTTKSEGAKTARSSTKKSKTTTKQKAGVANIASGWQPYVREEFNNISLPSAVHAVLQREAERVFEIPAVMNTIFVDDLPTEAGSKARRQITNILSNGALKNKWYRGQLGFYSMSKAAAKGNVG